MDKKNKKESIILFLGIVLFMLLITFMAIIYIKIDKLNEQYKISIIEGRNEWKNQEIIKEENFDILTSLMDKQVLLEKKLEENELFYEEFLEKEIDQLRVRMNLNSREQSAFLGEITLILNKKLQPQSADPFDSQILLENVYRDGFQLYEQKQYQKSLPIFAEASKQYPEDHEINFYYLASLYHSDPGNIKNHPALKFGLELLTYDLDFAEESLLILVDISLVEDDLEKTAVLYRRLYEFDDTNTDFLKSQGMIEYQLSNCSKASDLLETYLYTSPDDYEAVYYYGLSLFETGDYQEALEQFNLTLNSNIQFRNLEEKIKEVQELL